MAINFSLEEQTSFQEASGLPLIDDVQKKSDAELHAYRSGLRRFKKTIQNRKKATEEEKDCWAIAAELEDTVNAEMLERHERKTGEGKFELLMKPFVVNGGGERTMEQSKEWRSLFPNVGTSQDEFKNVGEFFQAAAAPYPDARLKLSAVEQRMQEETVGVHGGFAVPPGFETFLMDKALTQDEVFRPLCMIIPMETASISAPLFDTEDRSTNGSLFGLKMEMRAEAQELTEQTAFMKSIYMKAKKGAILWRCSRELLADAPSFSVSLMNLLPKEIANGLDSYFYEGNGAGEPLGVLTANSTIGVTRNTPGSMLYADVKAMWAKMHPACFRNAIWITNSQSIPQLLDLKDSNNNAIWHPGMSGSIKDGIPMTLFGRPIHYMQGAKGLGVAGDICLLDPTCYMVGLRQGIILESSSHAGFTTDTTYFRLTMRFDGMPMFSKPIKMPDSTELSWAVALE